MILIEGDISTRFEWVNSLSCTVSEFDRLIDRGVFERTPDGSWKLRFVGALVLATKLWFCIPRIARGDFSGDEPDLILLERISKTLEVYKSRSEARTAGNEQLATRLNEIERAGSPLRELEILAGLIDWTASYGFHTSETNEFSANLPHGVHWSQTISRSLPLHAKSSVVYFDPVCVQTAHQPTALGAMQAHAIQFLFGKYRFVAHRLIQASSDFAIEADRLLSIWPDKVDLSLQTLQDISDSTNRDHDKDLVSLLMALISIDDALRNKEADITLQGTTAFETVWEDMCRAVILGNTEVDPKLSNAQYRLSQGNFVREVPSQRPDVVCVYGGKTMILDAKYYPDFPQRRPNLEDVRKQIFYALSLPVGTASMSAFLFPSSSNECVEYLGEVTMCRPLENSECSRDARFPSVPCLGLPWRQVMDCYLGKTSSGEFRIEVLSQLIEHDNHFSHAGD